MSEISTWHRFLPALTTVVALVAGCVPIDDTKLTVNAKDEVEQNAKAGVEQWRCGDYVGGCGFLSTDCVTLTANLRDGTGEVSFGAFVGRTEFHIQGIERRWDWCPEHDGSFGCAFVISPDGRGRYFNFAASLPDPDGVRRAKPTDLFKCTKS